MVAIALAGLLFLLSALHVAWAAGIRLGHRVVIPEVEGRPMFTPSRNATLFVAGALLAGSLLALAQGHLFPALLPDVLVQSLTFAAGTVFLLRAVGEFRIAGFFKRVRDTTFARWDTWCFSPLCAAIGAAYWYLALH